MNVFGYFLGKMCSKLKIEVLPLNLNLAFWNKGSSSLFRKPAFRNLSMNHEYFCLLVILALPNHYIYTAL